MTIVIPHDAGYEINNTYSERFDGNTTYIHKTLIPTVPITDKIIGTAE